MLFIVSIPIDEYRANSVLNDTTYVAQCREQGPGPLDGPLDIKPGKEKPVSPYDCVIVASSGDYVGCLLISGTRNTFLVSAAAQTVPRNECNKTSR